MEFIEAIIMAIQSIFEMLPLIIVISVIIGIICIVNNISKRREIINQLKKESKKDQLLNTKANITSSIWKESELICKSGNLPTCEEIASENHIDKRVLVYYLRHRTSITFEDMSHYSDEIGDVSSALNELENAGWIREKEPREILKSLLTVEELKKILYENNMKVSGKKDILIDRVLEKIPFSAFNDIYTNKQYNITETGLKNIQQKQIDYNTAIKYATLCAKNKKLRGISAEYQKYDEKWGFVHISGKPHSIFANYDVPIERIIFLSSYPMKEINNSNKFKDDLRGFLIAASLRKPKGRYDLAIEFRLINDETFICPNIIELFQTRNDLPEVDEQELRYIKEGMYNKIKTEANAALEYYISLLIYWSKNS